ncbi:MAG TPA: ABC transporter permease [Candidatus Saccharimonadales bacterium]|nr:ABC transporter permease [Candidatus Saccharimonadales bacterium]
MSMRHGNLKLAWQSVKAAKARSFLTMLGIVVGVAAVVLMVCIGQGVKQQISGQLSRYGKDTFTVQPGVAGRSVGALTGLGGTNSTLLSQHDLTMVEKTTGVSYAVPLSTTSGSITGDHMVAAPFVVATTADLPKVIGESLQYGGFFDPGDNDKGVVLGSAIAHRLFDDNAPLGQTLTWRGRHFIVAGVFNNFNAPPFSLEAGFNNAVFVPYATAQELTGSVLGLYEIIAKADAGANLEQVVSAVHGALVTAHGGADDVTVLQTNDNNAASNRTIHLLTVLVTGGALIALVVGGVGIMDVMLVSVTERMHEIGLRKAIGATNQQIMRQFMAEAFVLSGLGALVGLALAAASVGLLRLYTSLQPILVWQIFVVTPLVAVAIGMFFGSMPALKAAYKDPIEALRHQ